jgi:Tol biopolymer transport system component
MRTILVGVAATVTLVVMAVVGPAGAPAALPGSPGVIAYARVSYDASAKTGRYLGDGHIHVIAADGTGDQALTYGHADDYEPAFSPDGSQIVFSRVGKKGKADLYLMNADGSNVHRVTFGLGSDAAAWSPDGSEIAVDATKGIYVMAADGTGLHRITRNAKTSFDFVPAWTADGSSIIFTRAKLDNGRNVGEALWTMAADGTDAHRLLGGSGDLLYAQQADVSPDGAQIAFVGSTAKRSALYIANVDGGNVHRIFASQMSLNGPAFSPDGTRVVVTRQGSDGRSGARLISFDLVAHTRATVTRVTQGTVEYPNWQPLPPPASKPK